MRKISIWKYTHGCNNYISVSGPDLTSICSTWRCCPCFEQYLSPTNLWGMRPPNGGSNCFYMIFTLGDIGNSSDPSPLKASPASAKIQISDW